MVILIYSVVMTQIFLIERSEPLTVLSVLNRDSLVAKTVKNLPAIQETWVLYLDIKIPWRMEWQPSIFAWRIPGERWLVGSMGSQRVGHSWVTKTFTVLNCYFLLTEITDLGTPNMYFKGILAFYFLIFIYFLKIFLIQTIFKVFIELVTMLLLFCMFWFFDL